MKNYRYIKDYKGNNVAVQTTSVTLAQMTDYYPYGEPWREPSGQPWLSPYSYCGGDPVIAVDNDGRLIICINGMHFGDGGRREYWGSFLTAFSKAIGDRRVIFYDGSCGGLSGLASTRYGISNHTARSRYISGKAKGRAEAKKKFSVLQEGETLKILTHSMGGTYAKGFVEELVRYAEEGGIDVGKLIEYEVDLAPFQPTKQTPVENVNTISVQHYNDGVAGADDMPGATPLKLHRDRFGRGFNGLKLKFTEHTIESFTKDIVFINGKLNR